MSEPEGPDATRRTLLRGVVVLGAVGVGAGLSRIGEGTKEIPATEAVQASTPDSEVAAPEATPAATAEPTKSPKSNKSDKSTTSAKPSKSAEPSKSDKTTSAKQAKSEKPKAAKPKPAGKPLGPSSKVPVGGGVIYKDARVVVTQPKAGEYKAFDALCTHAACLVDQVKANVIHCPCHSAKFSAADGSVVKPSVARRPLTPKTVTEADGTIYLT